MRWITAGESHGQALSAIIEGMPAHVAVTTEDIDFHLARRRLGVGRGARQNFERIRSQSLVEFVWVLHKVDLSQCKWEIANGLSGKR